MSRLIVRSAILCSLMILTPVAFSSSDGLRRNTACSEGQQPDCVPEIDAVCTAGSMPLPNHYTRLQGR